MKQDIIHQEILLNANANFFNRKLCLKDSNSNDTASCSPLERLEKVCWAGLLFELLPELVDQPSGDCKTYLWRTLHGEQFLMVNSGSYPALVDMRTSIDPYSFLFSVLYN